MSEIHLGTWYKKPFVDISCNRRVLMLTRVVCRKYCKFYLNWQVILWGWFPSLCQKVWLSLSRKFATPKPRLQELTVQIASPPISGNCFVLDTVQETFICVCLWKYTNVPPPIANKWVYVIGLSSVYMSPLQKQTVKWDICFKGMAWSMCIVVGWS